MLSHARPQKYGPRVSCHQSVKRPMDNHVEAVEADGKRSMAFAAVNISFINLSVTCRS